MFMLLINILQSLSKYTLVKLRIHVCCIDESSVCASVSNGDSMIFKRDEPQGFVVPT